MQSIQQAMQACLWHSGNDKVFPWWCHPMEMSFTLLAICVTGEFPTQRPVAWNFDVFFDLRLNKQFNKQWWGWWFETPSCLLWRHCSAYLQYDKFSAEYLQKTSHSSPMRVSYEVSGVSSKSELCMVLTLSVVSNTCYNELYFDITDHIILNEQVEF